jgi:hypothetical protein
VVVASKEKEGSELVWRLEAGVHTFYRGARVLRSGAWVDHGAAFLDGEGARRGACEVGDIMAVLVSVTARRKVV